MEEKNITEKEGLFLISQMIQTARQEQNDDGKGWIIWGWVLFLASISSVLLVWFKWDLQLFFFWNIFGGIALAYFVYELFANEFFRKRRKVRTYAGDLFARLNAGFFISLIFIIVFINVGARALYHRYNEFNLMPITMGFALLINLYAFWILIYGAALNFKPSIIAAYATWGIGFVALFSKTFEHTMLLHALAALVGYIIPGHIANKEFKKIRGKDKVVESV